MGISEELKKQLRNGDYLLIAEMYKERHELTGDYKTVTATYVKMVIDGERAAKPNTAAEEIMLIADKFLKHRREFIDQILTV